MELTCLGFCCRLLNPGWPFSEDSVLSFCLALVKQFYTELIIRLIKKKKRNQPQNGAVGCLSILPSHISLMSDLL